MLFVNFIFQDVKEVKAISCQFFNSYNGTGIAVMTSTYRLFVVNNVDDPRIRRLAEVPGLLLIIYIFFFLK